MLTTPRPVPWMVCASVASCLALVAILGRDLAGAVFAGMAGPLVAAVGTWRLADVTYRQSPERLTAFMTTAFAAKLVLFGGYVSVCIGLLRLQPVPFVVTFTVYYIGLHLAEALCLRRLFLASAAGVTA